MKLLHLVKDFIINTIKVLTSKRGLKEVYGVSLYRNAMYLALRTAVTGITGFLFWVVASRLYPAEAIGLASAAISATALLALISTIGLEFGLIRFLPALLSFSRK